MSYIKMKHNFIVGTLVLLLLGIIVYGFSVAPPTKKEVDDDSSEPEPDDEEGTPAEIKARTKKFAYEKELRQLLVKRDADKKAGKTVESAGVIRANLNAKYGYKVKQKTRR